MTSYVSIPNGDIDQDSPITQPLMTALRDNPLAISEGDTTAPVNTSSWHAYNKVLNNDANTGVIWSFAVNGAVAAVTTPDFVDGFEYMLFFDNIRASIGITATMRINFYRETSAAYAGVMGINITATSSSPVSATIDLLAMRQTRRFHAATNIIQRADGADGNINQAVNPDNYITRHTTAQKILRAQLTFDSGNITGSGATGAIYLYKRKFTP
jgi:hypothetical protein